MWLFTDIADWWDTQRNQTEDILDDFVSNNPNQFGIIVATGVHTAMTVGAGVVDLLRLGDGVIQGTLGGVAQDGLRLIGVAVPAARGYKITRTMTNTKLANLIVDVGGPRCSWINSTKALVQTGHKTSNGKMYASVNDLLSRLRLNLNDVGGISLLEMTATLRTIGAKVGSVLEVSSVAQAMKYVKRDGSVVLVSLKGIKNGNVVAGHAVYFFKDYLGRARIMDRTGLYDSIGDLAKTYGQVDEFIPRAIAPLDNIYGKYMAPDGSAVLAIEVLGVAHSHPGHE